MNTKQDLRRQAEAFLADRALPEELTATAEALLYELQVHQVELELQNEELRSAQLEAEQARSLYQALFEEAPVGYLVLDAEGKVLQANQATYALLRMQREALVGRRLQVFLSNPDAVRTLNEHLARCFASAEPQECELTFRRGDAATVHLSLHSRSVEEPAGSRTCRVGLIDVSARKRAEDRLRELNDELERRVAKRTRSLEASQQASELLERRLAEAERLEAIGRLAGGVAHDFNNMLMVINGSAELALGELPPNHPTREALERILLAGQRSARLTSQLLAFGRRQRLSPEQVDLTLLVQETCALLTTTLGPAVHISFTPPAARIGAMADPGGLQQALVNLALNARDAMPGGGELELSVDQLELSAEEAARWPGARAGRYAVLAIRDEGVGLTPESCQHLFEPFFTTKTRGTGLGLSSVHGFVSQSGGFVTVESAPSLGATFRVHLPQIEPPTEQPAAARGRELAPEPRTGAILVVEDEDLLRDLFVNVLRGAGLEVIAAGNGAEALRLCRERAGRPVEVALLDIVMPGMDGLELAKHLRELLPSCPVIFMSGYVAEDLARQIDGAVEGSVLQKPLSAERLLAEVERVLQR